MHEINREAIRDTALEQSFETSHCWLPGLSEALQSRMRWLFTASIVSRRKCSWVGSGPTPPLLPRWASISEK